MEWLNTVTTNSRSERACCPSIPEVALTVCTLDTLHQMVIDGVQQAGYSSVGVCLVLRSELGSERLGVIRCVWRGKAECVVRAPCDARSADYCTWFVGGLLEPLPPPWYVFPTAKTWARMD